MDREKREVCHCSNDTEAIIDNWLHEKRQVEYLNSNGYWKLHDVGEPLVKTTWYRIKPAYIVWCKETGNYEEYEILPYTYSSNNDMRRKGYKEVHYSWDANEGNGWVKEQRQQELYQLEVAKNCFANNSKDTILQVFYGSIIQTVNELKEALEELADKIENVTLRGVCSSLQHYDERKNLIRKLLGLDDIEEYLNTLK